MQAVSVSKTKPMVRKVHSTGANQNVGTGKIYQEVVSPGTLRKGDFVTPNPWGYTCTRKIGSSIQFDTYDLLPVKKLIYTHTGPFNSQDLAEPYELAWPDRTLVYNMCLDKLNQRVRGELDLGVALAELGSTKRMLLAAAKTIRYAKGYRGISKSISKDAANGWLQWQYGWKPLCKDVFSAADESIRFTLNKLQRFKARVSLPIERNFSEPLNGFATTFDSNVKLKGKQSCTLCITLEVQDFDLARWSSLNPVSLAWEVIPYSFVVDWFYDVGSYLRNLETSLLYRTAFKRGYKSELFVYDSHQVIPSGTVASNSTSSAWKVVTLPAIYKVRHRQFSRTVLASYPSPRLPTFKVDLGSYQMISAGALLRQLF